MYSEPNTMLTTTLHNLYADRDFEITQDEAEEFIHFCVAVFASCEEQLPSDLAVFIYELGMDVDEFLDIGLKTASTVKRIRKH